MALQLPIIFKDYASKLSTFQLLVILLSTLAVYIFFQNTRKWLKKQKNTPPGPLGLPIVGYLPFLGLEPHKTLWKLREKYGDVMSLYMGNKYTILLNEYNVAKEVLSHQSALDRAPEQFHSLPCIGFQVENGEKWVEQRRFCLTATRDLGIGKGIWEDMITDEIANFIEKLRKTEGKPTDISHTLALSVSSNILSLLIGRQLHKEKEVDKVELSLKFTEAAFSFMGPAEPASLVPGLRKILEFCGILGYDKAAKIVKKFSSFVREEISRHKSSPEFHDVHDFINTYMNKQEKLSTVEGIKHYFSEFMLEGNLTILFLGGSDTVMSSLGWLMRLMCEYKDIQEKVYAELMEVLGKDGKARYDEKDRIPYTFAVLMESQRVSSIVPISTTRRLIQDISVNGYVLPKGAEVAANLWGLHHDPTYWKQPEQFMPQRFLTDDGTKLRKNVLSYFPFSTGRRNCPGETIAWREILGYFTEIIKKFEISTPEGKVPEYEVVNGLVSHLKPQALCFKERKSN